MQPLSIAIAEMKATMEQTQSWHMEHYWQPYPIIRLVVPQKPRVNSVDMRSHWLTIAVWL